MKLQSDPTIVYGLVGGKGTLGRGILRSEIEKATPYNTYVIEGLPPGPIANPGRAALEAVANPSRTKDLYFVADGSGGHAFAETYDQHQRNVTRWRQIEKRPRPTRRRRPRRAAADAGRDAAPRRAGDAARVPPDAPAQRRLAAPRAAARRTRRAARAAAFDACEGTARGSAPQPSLRPELAEERAGR